VTGRLHELVERVISTVEPELTAGLGEEQARWAVETYRRVVLPSRLDVTEDRDDATAQRWADREAQSIAERYRSVDVDRRWSMIVVDHYASKLGPLEAAAFALARRAAAGGDGVRDAALDVQQRLHALREEIEASAPAVMDELASEISEALMDCAFVLDGPDFCSIRMGRWLEGDA